MNVPSMHVPYIGLMYYACTDLVHLFYECVDKCYHSMHGSGMEQECRNKYTVNNYLGSTKFLQLQVQLLFICFVCSVVMTVDLLLAPSEATAVDMPEG